MNQDSSQYFELTIGYNLQDTGTGNIKIKPNYY